MKSYRHWIIAAGLSFFVSILGFWYVRELRRVSAVGVESWTEDRTAECAVVLTGGPGRIREGFDLLDQGMVKKLIISGVHPEAKLREVFPMLGSYSKINTQDVILERYSQTTYGNAQQSLPIVETLQCRDILLVTSRSHMYRAYRTFRQSFPANLPIYPRSVVSGEYRPSAIEVIWETLKSMFYSTWVY